MRIRLKSRYVLYLLIVLILSGYGTRAFWLRGFANSLVCNGTAEKSDVILIENLDTDYLLFQRAAQLRQSGMGKRVLVPVATGADCNKPELVDLKIAELMCELARITDPVIMPVEKKEPITLRLARQVAVRLQADGVRSVIIVTAGFRSHRAYMVYRKVLSPLGIRFSCLAVFGGHRPDNWTESLHSIEEVLEQFVKLQYYRWVVL